MTFLGRSATVSTVKAGETATFLDKRNSRKGMAFSAKQSDSKFVVLAHSMGADVQRLIVTDGGGWANVPAWVLPSKAGMFVDHVSRDDSSSLELEEIWNTLHVDPRGFIYLPVYEPRIGMGRLSGWYNLSTGELETDLDDGRHPLQCFRRWGFRMFDKDDGEIIWQSW